MKKTMLKSEAGVALVLALIFMVGLSAILGILSLRLTAHGRQVNNQVDFLMAREGLDSAMAIATLEAERAASGTATGEDGDAMVGLNPNFDPISAWKANPRVILDFSDDTGNPVIGTTLPSTPRVEFFAFTLNWANDTIDNNGINGVDDLAELGFFSIHAGAHAGNTTRRSELVLSGGNVNIWNNAIFGGGGQAGGLINGNVSVHGSLHLLGSNLDPNDVTIEALDLSGTSLVHNNYEGLGNELDKRVPDLPQTVVDGETVDTLDAILRVKNGLVGMSGNSEVGEEQQTGNSFKETMDGIYVNDAWSGNGLDTDGNPINAFSDNGTDSDYDLGDKVPFPTYDDDGGKDHLADYLTFDPDPNVGLHAILQGAITIEYGEPFYWNSTTMTTGDSPVIGETPSGNPVDPMPLKSQLDPNEFYIWFDGQDLQINGRIPIDGNFTMQEGIGQNNNKPFLYEGKGTILTYDGPDASTGGDISLNASLLTPEVAGGNPPNFPNPNLIGMMAQNNLNLGMSESQQEFMGGFYAENQISAGMQSTIMGTIVGDLFSMASQVPDIYQVPELKDAWLERDIMIGAGPVVVLSPLAWREIGVP